MNEFPPAAPGAAPFWEFVRCAFVIRSDDGPPNACHKDQGGCDRPHDPNDFDKSETKFRPASWADTIEARDAVSLVTLDELIADLKEIVRFPRREDYVLALLWASQSWLGPDVLPEKCLAYLAFTGPKSAGKTTATESLCQLAGGPMIAGGTEAAIRDILNGGESGIAPRALGIDEIDVKGKQLPDLEGIFRTGNRWNAKYPMRVPQGKGWATVMTNVGGPKVFNYRTAPEDALASRTVLIDLEKYDDAKMIIEGLFNNPILDRIRFVLSKKAALASPRWSMSRMEEHMKSKDFIARVEHLEAQLPR